MTRNKYLFVVFLWCLNSIHAQDLLNGIGGFDNANPLNSWTTTTNGSGNFEAITSESYFGTTSLKTEVTMSNADDVKLTNSTNFSVNSGVIYTASFYLKGTVNNEFSISLMNSLFTIISNQLYYNSSTPPDYKTKPRYLISVKATDGGLSRQQEIAVDVSAVNLAPTALILSKNQIFQGMPTDNRGMLVGYITVTDNDLSSPVQHIVLHGGGRDEEGCHGGPPMVEGGSWLRG